MAGLDPSVYQSGQYVGLSKISKLRNRHLRRIIWLMTVKVIQFEGYFRRYFEQRIKDGLLYKKAVLATAHKLIRVIFAMLSNKTLFNAKAIWLTCIPYSHRQSRRRKEITYVRKHARGHLKSFLYQFHPIESLQIALVG